MVNNRVPSVFSKTYVTPRRPFEKARLDQELKIIGEYGLRNKREVWRVKYTLARIRKAARELLTLEEKDPKRLFEGNLIFGSLLSLSHGTPNSRMSISQVKKLFSYNKCRKLVLRRCCLGGAGIGQPRH